ncbi:MAG: SDR family oxidoreductase [Alkalilacustris sp.]
MTDRTCMIIGGGRGMGAAIAREMHARGYSLALMSPSASCEALAAELGGVAHRGRAETAADIQALIDLTMERYGRIDAVLIHVGSPPKGDLLEIPVEEWDRANRLVLHPVIETARRVTPIMEAQGGGAIVAVTTFSALEPSLLFPTSSVYRVGVSAFAKLYSDRYGRAGIRMNCLLPGFTDSLDVGKHADKAALGRIARVEEQAKAAAFLLTDDSSYITGQSLRVDGGVTRHL